MFHILVIDDDRNARRYMQALLEGEHYTVSTAGNGLEALDIMDGAHIDLAILDIMMPGMDGLEFTRTLREGKSDLPILMVSAKQLPADRKQAFMVGTDDYMTKPVDGEELLLHVKALLRRAKIASDRRIEIGQVVLDYDSMTVTGHGEVQELPQKEFLLLFKRLSYPGRIFTRIQLMDEIWDLDTESDEHTVNVHINKLRDRFRDNHDFEIVTVRGLGYKAVKQ